MREICSRGRNAIAAEPRRKLQVQFRSNLSRHNRDRDARPTHHHPDELFAGVEGLRETPGKPPVDVAVNVRRTGTSDSDRVGIVLVLSLPAKVNMIADFQPCGGVVLPPSNIQVEDPESRQSQVAGGGLLTGLFTHESELTLTALNSEGECSSGATNQFGISFFFREPRFAGRSAVIGQTGGIQCNGVNRLLRTRWREELRHQPAYEGNAQKDAYYYPHEETSVSTVSRTLAEEPGEQKQ